MKTAETVKHLSQIQHVQTDHWIVQGQTRMHSVLNLGMKQLCKLVIVCENSAVIVE